MLRCRIFSVYLGIIEEGKFVKKNWEKPTMKVVPCDIRELKGNIKEMSDEELREQLNHFGYYANRKFTANKNYILREIAGESVLVSVGEEIADFCGIVNLNHSARCLWDILQGKVTKEELVKALVYKFEVSEETAQKDVENTLNILQERGLVKNV